MFRRKLKNSFYLTIFLISIFSISFGYALLNSTLIIMGTSAIQKNTWDIHFDNLNITEGSVTATTAPSITDSNRISDFTFVLDKRGDYYEFTVDIVNSGSLDAMIDSVEMTPSLTTEQEKYLTYTITYENNEEIKKNQLVKVNDFVRIKVRVEFKSDITAADLPQTQQVLNLGFHINYVQADENGVVVNDNGTNYLVKVISGDYDTVGSEIAIGDEHFYIIASDSDSIKMLAKYNLYVGNQCTSTSSSSCTPYGSEATGIQDPMMVGYASGQSVYKGTIAFSSVGSSYSGSIVEGYVNNYKNYLITQGITPTDARLITKDELISLGCSDSSCTPAPKWVYQTTYWTMSAFDSSFVWDVYSYGYLVYSIYEADYAAGIRPVIEIDKNQIPSISPKAVADGDVNEIGTIVTIGSEQFYTIGTEGDNVKLLSMYNLYVGGTSSKLYGDEATGMQDSSMLGNTSSSNNGVSVFSSASKKGTNYSDYKGSQVEEYVNNYKNILESDFGVEVVEARLITKDELSSFGCSWNKTCSTQHSFIYSTSYWTGTAANTESIYGLFSDGLMDIYSYECYFYGVRPVIVISKDNF